MCSYFVDSGSYLDEFSLKDTPAYAGSAEEAGWGLWSSERIFRVYLDGKVIWEDVEYLGQVVCAECGTSALDCKHAPKKHPLYDQFMSEWS